MYKFVVKDEQTAHGLNWGWDTPFPLTFATVGDAVNEAKRRCESSDVFGVKYLKGKLFLFAGCWIEQNGDVEEMILGELTR